MRYTTAQEGVVIPLGRQGENNILTVQFPIDAFSDVIDNNGAFELLHQRCMDTVPYPCPITVTDEYVTWVVRNSDTAYVGRGQAQLVYVVDGSIAKSIIYATSVLKSIDGDGDFPEPYEERLTEILTEAQYIHEHLSDADQAAEDAEAWAVGTRQGEDVDVGDETYHNNSKYYSEQAADSARAASDSANNASSSADDAERFQNNASDSADAAELSAQDAEAWAVGTRDGVAVPSTDTTYHNNSKYWHDLLLEEMTPISDAQIQALFT